MVRRIIATILFSFFLLGPCSNLWAAPIGFQGNPAQFPYATRPLGPGFQSQFSNPNRFFIDPTMAGPGFNPTRGTFPLNQDPRSRFFDPSPSPTPMVFPSQRGF